VLQNPVLANVARPDPAPSGYPQNPSRVEPGDLLRRENSCGRGTLPEPHGPSDDRQALNEGTCRCPTPRSPDVSGQHHHAAEWDVDHSGIKLARTSTVRGWERMAIFT
jgi:hypothetical protein